MTATVGIELRADCAGFGLDVALAINLPGLEPQVMQELVEAAYAACPIRTGPARAWLFN